MEAVIGGCVFFIDDFGVYLKQEMRHLKTKCLVQVAEQN